MAGHGRWRRQVDRAVTAAEPTSQERSPSAARPSPFTPIADYAFISNCHTGALIAPDGAIDWLCVPAFDSPSAFGSLLDREAGMFRFGPYGIVHPTARSYDPGTNVLLTTWKTPTGWILVSDALTMGPNSHEDRVTPHTRPPADDDGDHMLVRLVECLEGTVEVELVCEPSFDYGRTPAEWTLLYGGRHAADASGAGQTIRLHTDLSLGLEGSRARARHVLERGERAYCSLSWAEDLAGPKNVDEAEARIAATTRYWRSWLGRARIPDHAWRDPIQRSAIAIKGLTYMPTGATVAALTTSLPETPGGERNWDYRYTWMRDSTFTLQALHWLNLDWEADEFMRVEADPEPTDDGWMKIMYGIDGRRDLTGKMGDEVTGYDGAGPVRKGNGAFDQRQNDVFGAVLDSILLHTRKAERLPRRLWPIVESQAECASQVWRQTDQGIWEARGKPQHYVSSKLMCWVALDRARRSRRSAAMRSARRAGVRRPTRSVPTSSTTASAHGASTPALRDRRARCVTLSPRASACCPGRRATSQHRVCDRRRADRGRLRAPLRTDDTDDGLSGRRDVSHLLVLARLRTRDRRRHATRRDLMERLLRIASPLGLYAEEFDPRPAAISATSRRRSRTWR